MARPVRRIRSGLAGFDWETLWLNEGLIGIVWPAGLERRCGNTGRRVSRHPAVMFRKAPTARSAGASPRAANAASHRGGLTVWSSDQPLVGKLPWPDLVPHQHIPNPLQPCGAEAGDCLQDCRHSMFPTCRRPREAAHSITLGGLCEKRGPLVKQSSSPESRRPMCDGKTRSDSPGLRNMVRPLLRPRGTCLSMEAYLDRSRRLPRFQETPLSGLWLAERSVTGGGISLSGIRTHSSGSGPNDKAGSVLGCNEDW